MVKQKAGRNKTIDISLEDGQAYLSRCIEVKKPISLEEAMNKTILGDALQTAKLLPEKSVDLIIADPPYNLSKEFHGKSFSKKNEGKYEEYTREWFDAILPLLKDEGSIYICCDWESSMIIGRVLMEKVMVRNRITWQREKGQIGRASCRERV